MFDINEWYRDFLTWMRTERGQEALEIQTDCSSELYLNALVALHLRRYGRDLGISGWWARCEWAKVDISFGAAKGPFDDWNAAWYQGITGDVGQIEGKVLYWHYTESVRKNKLAELRRELTDRRDKDVDYRQKQLYLGLVWMVSYEQPGHDESLESLLTHRSSRQVWAELFADNGLRVHDAPVERPESAVFDHVKTLNLSSLWPITKADSASLWVTLLEFT